VYTDEHGNAEAWFNPNGGFNLTADANSRCSSFLTGPSTFTTHITATAVYPYKKVAAAQTSAPLTKTVTTAALKSLSCIKKGPNEAFCVETVHDIWGNPVAGVPVKFNANSIGNAQLQPDSAVLGGFDTTGQDYIATPGENFVLVRTNDLGEAGVAVTDSLGTDCVNVRAENLATKVNGNPGVSVFADFNPATGTTCSAGGTTGGGNGQGTNTTPVTTTTSDTNHSSNTSSSNSSVSNSSTSNNGSTAGTTAQGAPTAIGNTPPSVVSVTGHKVTVSISVARFITVGHTKYLGVKLASTAKTAKVNITLIGKHGKVIGHLAKTIKTNTLVRVMKVGTTVKSVRVSALSV
jgi:hypothetical protein